MIILDKVYKDFFHCEDFLNWAYKLHLTCMFLLALETEFERAMYLRDEGYDIDANYNLPQAKQENYLCLCSYSSGMKLPLIPWGPQESKMHPLTSAPKGRPIEPPLQQMTHRCLSFRHAPPPVVDHDDEEEEEEYFPTAPLDDLVWSEEPVLERALYIHMAPKRPEASYSSQIPTQPQELVYEPVFPEELMEGMFSDMINIIDIPQQVLFESFLYCFLLDVNNCNANASVMVFEL